MGKDKKLIMVVKRKKLFEEEYFQGFMPKGRIDYESNILANFTYIRRGEAEANQAYKQPIAYSLLVNPALKAAFAYRRAGNENCSEGRLRGKWSLGIGGHIEKSDSENVNPIHASLVRELGEEVEIPCHGEPKLLGYINDDTEEVGKVHFGMLYAIETSSNTVKPKGREIAEGALMPLEELEKKHFEFWGIISLRQLRRYIQNLA